MTTAIQDASAVMLHAVSHPLVVKVMNAEEQTPTEAALIAALEATADLLAAYQADSKPAQQQPAAAAPAQS